MDFFGSLQDMKFGEAYEEMASTLFQEVKAGIQQGTQMLKEDLPNPSAYIEQFRDKTLDV